MKDRSRPTLLVAVALVALCLVVFGQAITFELVWDDKNLIANNPFLHQSSTLWRAFSHDFWALTPVAHESQFYRPLVIVAYWVEYHLFDGSPAGFHAVNLAVHTLNTLLVLALARRFTLTPLQAACAAVLFAVHPVQTVAVANVASQTDLFATAFVLAACLVWCRADRARWATLPLLFLGLLCKESAAVGPVLAIGCRWAVERVDPTRGPSRGPGRIAPLVVFVPYAALRMIALGGAGGGDPGATTRGGLQYAHYLVRLVMPLPEAPVVSPAHPSLVLVIVSTIALAGAIVLLVRSRSVDPRLRLSVGWFLFALLPVAELVPLGTRQNDLLLYLPVAGIALAVAQLTAGAPRRAVPVLVLLLAGAVLTHVRVAVWRDSMSLWSAAVVAEPHEPAIRLNYANALRERGQIEEGCAQLAALLDDLATHPNIDVEVRATYNLANCARARRELTVARDLYARAFRGSGNRLGPAGHNLVLTLVELGQAREAIAVAEQVVALDERVASSWAILGLAQLRAGEREAAGRALEHASAIDPSDAVARSLRDELARAH